MAEDQSQKTILLAEDEAFLRDLYSEQLVKAGFAVDQAVDGQDAADKFKLKPYDLFLLDIMMPKMNGIDVLKQIHELAEKNSTKIVMLTNLGQDDIMKEAQSLGATGYIIKVTVDPYQMVDTVKSYFS